MCTSMCLVLEICEIKISQILGLKVGGNKEKDNFFILLNVSIHKAMKRANQLSPKRTILF